MLLLFLCFMPMTGCATKLSRFEFTELIMGVEANVTLYAPDELVAREAARAAFDRMNELDDVLSDYREDSEAMRLCQTHDVPVPVSDDLYDTLERSIEISEKTGGAFDVTLGPVVQLWRKARRTEIIPDARELAEARERVGWNLIELDPEARTVTLRAEGMRLDFGGIGKGYAAQEAVDTLRALGLVRCLVDLGGDLVAGEGPPAPRNMPSIWFVEVRFSENTSDSWDLAMIEGAVATSGYQTQYVNIDNVQYSHIVDPRTGLGLTNRTSVMVRAPDGATADALASALSVMDRENAAQLMNRFPNCLAIVEVETDKGKFNYLYNNLNFQPSTGKNIYVMPSIRNAR
ncbi:MAG: FAD:protein FMN transferase [Planctomycetota bacterium]|nr:FAD:protein FMN transferase [Planctomycetota bacterium]